MCKGSLATGLDAGEAFLHMRRAQWGHSTCVYCTVHVGGENLPCESTLILTVGMVF